MPVHKTFLTKLHDNWIIPIFLKYLMNRDYLIAAYIFFVTQHNTLNSCMYTALHLIIYFVFFTYVTISLAG
jgi:hypothetical protein